MEEEQLREVSKEPRYLILCVDDSRLTRSSYDRLFSRSFDIVFADSAHGALEMLKSVNPDAAIVDIMMPKMNGLDLVKEIKKIHPHLPIIAITGIRRNHSLYDEVKAICDDIIEKPFHFEPAMIVSRLARLIASYKQKQELIRQIDIEKRGCL